MANFVFKETKQTAMKIVGILNSNDLTINVDGEEKKLSTLLSVFNDSDVEINIKIKEENELVEPTEDENEDE
jgi:hypothetical protein|nr:MAG TPA: YonK protein [Caudoviricetes sp.]DAV83504.1 MAG TPA: YonK protein [Caudoviricetes sp.]DAV93014.1 MAG TPA: YonK protein [Bacteriophage sp.]